MLRHHPLIAILIRYSESGFLLSVLSFLFLQITTLHNFSSSLEVLPLENLTLLGVLAFGVFRLLNEEELTRARTIQRLQFNFSIFLSIAAVGLVSSFFNRQLLSVFYDSEWRTFLKSLVVIVWMVSFKLSQREVRKLEVYTISFFNLLGAYFLYRYLVLHEIRTFDNRPLLNIRHGDPNFLGTFFATATPLCWWGIARNKRFFSLVSYYEVASFFFLSACMILTQSRMAILAYGIFYSFLIIKKIASIKSRRARLSGFATLLIATMTACYMIFTSDLGTRFKQLADKSNSDRIGTYINGAILFSESPIFGVGMHQAASSFYRNASYPLFQSEFNQLDIHNAFLKYLAELGILGLCASLLILGYVAFEVFRSKNSYLKGALFILVLCTMSLGASYKDMYYILLGLLMVFALSMREERNDCSI